MAEAAPTLFCRLHHVCLVVHDIDASEAEGRAAGLGVLMCGRRPDRSGFADFDTEAAAGMVLLARRSPE